MPLLKCLFSWISFMLKIKRLINKTRKRYWKILSTSAHLLSVSCWEFMMVDDSCDFVECEAPARTLLAQFISETFSCLEKALMALQRSHNIQPTVNLKLSNLLSTRPVTVCGWCMWKLWFKKTMAFVPGTQVLLLLSFKLTDLWML